MSIPGTHIKLMFHTPSGDTKTVIYKLEPEFKHRLEHWKASKLTPPTKRETAEWLEKHGAPLDSPDDEASYVVIGADGNRIKAWHRDGQPHRDGSKAAFIETNPYGGSFEAHYQHGHFHNLDNPAIVEKRSDGSCRNVWYTDGRLQHEEEIPAPHPVRAPGGP